MPKVITANRLHDGVVVYLTRNQNWSEELGEAWVVDGSEAVRDLENLANESVAKDVVVLAYAMDVAVIDGALRPTSVREEIRAAHAPSI